MSRVRTWCFTLNNPSSNEIPKHTHERYLIWQLETGQSGNIHLQGYIELTQSTRLQNMASWLPGAHFEPRRGTREQAREYCKKEDSRTAGPWERGDWESGGSGTRNDLADVKRKLDDGASELDIANDHFGTWCKHHRAFREYKKLKTEHRKEKTEVIVYWGDSGTGKTRKVLEEAPNACWKTRDEWWDNYDNQDDVILDDFYGWLPYDFLLRLLDRYPLDINCKGGQKRFTSKRIFITSNKPPEEWYPNIAYKEPLLRRIDKREHFTAFK